MSFRLGVDGYAFAKIDPVPTGARGHQDHRPDVLRRRGQPRLRAAHQLHQYERDRRRGAAPRNAPDGGLVPVELAARAIEGAPAAAAVHRGSRIRDDAGARDAGPRRRRLRRKGGPARPVQRRHRLFGIAVVHAERQLRALELHGIRRARRPRARHRPLLAAVQPLAHRSRIRTSTACRARSALQFRDVTQYVSAASDFSTTTMSGTLEFGYPITEYQGLRFGLVAQRSDLIVNPQSSAPEAVELGARQRQSLHAGDRAGDSRAAIRTIPPTIIETILFGTKFNTFELVGSWYFDTRNRAIFADRGLQHSLSVAVTVARQRGRLLHVPVRLPAAASDREAVDRRPDVGRSPTAMRSATTPRRCRRTGSSSRAAPIRCAASPRAASARRTASAILTAAT